MRSKYKRVLIKISGELLGSGRSQSSLDFRKITRVVKALKAVRARGVDVGVVVGAGNIFRARLVGDGKIDRVAADHMGMMGTIINGIALQSVFEKIGIDARVLSSISMPQIVEDYVYKRALKHFRNKRVVIFAGGTGRPFFTTDTAAVLRALEIRADVVLKASDVDGVYDADPHRSKKARKFDSLTFSEALERRLKVMDETAFALAQENNLPIIVFKFTEKNLREIINAKKIGTLVS